MDSALRLFRCRKRFNSSQADTPLDEIYTQHELWSASVGFSRVPCVCVCARACVCLFLGVCVVCVLCLCELFVRRSSSVDQPPFYFALHPMLVLFSTHHHVCVVRASRTVYASASACVGLAAITVDT